MLHAGPHVVVTSEWIDLPAGRLPLAQLFNLRRVITQPRFLLRRGRTRFELLATYRGAEISVLATFDKQEFERVTRAVIRALEMSREDPFTASAGDYRAPAAAGQPSWTSLATERTDALRRAASRNLKLSLWVAAVSLAALIGLLLWQWGRAAIDPDSPALGIVGVAFGGAVALASGLGISLSRINARRDFLAHATGESQKMQDGAGRA